MSSDEKNGWSSDHEFFACGEVFSPTKLEKGRIYVGGLVELTLHNDESPGKRKGLNDCTYNSLDLFNNCSDDDEESNSKGIPEIKDESKSFNNHIIQTPLSCPNCGGILSKSYQSSYTQVPPFCSICNSFFFSELYCQDEGMLHNLVDVLLKNDDAKGTIFFIENEIESNQQQSNDGSKFRKKPIHEKSIIESFSCEDEDSNLMIQRITTDDEQAKILNNLKKTSLIAKKTIQKKIAKEDYSLAQGTDGNKVQFRCKTCNMPLMQRKGKGTVCVTCPRIRSKARKNAKKMRLEKKEALKRLDFVNLPISSQAQKESNLREVEDRNVKVNGLSRIQDFFAKDDVETGLEPRKEGDILSLSVSDMKEERIDPCQERIDKYAQHSTDSLPEVAKKMHELTEPGKTLVGQEPLPVPFDISFSNSCLFQTHNRTSMLNEIKPYDIKVDDLMHDHQEEIDPQTNANLFYDKYCMDNQLQPDHISEGASNQSVSKLNSSLKPFSISLRNEVSSDVISGDKKDSPKTNETDIPKTVSATRAKSSEIDSFHINDIDDALSNKENGIKLNNNLGCENSLKINWTDSFEEESKDQSCEIERIEDLSHGKSRINASLKAQIDKKYEAEFHLWTNMAKLLMSAPSTFGKFQYRNKNICDEKNDVESESEIVSNRNEENNSQSTTSNRTYQSTVEPRDYLDCPTKKQSLNQNGEVDIVTKNFESYAPLSLKWASKASIKNTDLILDSKEINSIFNKEFNQQGNRNNKSNVSLQSNHSIIKQNDDVLDILLNHEDSYDESQCDHKSTDNLPCTNRDNKKSSFEGSAVTNVVQIQLVDNCERMKKSHYFSLIHQSHPRNQKIIGVKDDPLLDEINLKDEKENVRFLNIESHQNVHGCQNTYHPKYSRLEIDSDLDMNCTGKNLDVFAPLQYHEKSKDNKQEIDNSDSCSPRPRETALGALNNTSYIKEFGMLINGRGECNVLENKNDGNTEERKVQYSYGSNMTGFKTNQSLIEGKILDMQNYLVTNCEDKHVNDPTNSIKEIYDPLSQDSTNSTCESSQQSIDTCIQDNEETTVKMTNDFSRRKDDISKQSENPERDYSLVDVVESYSVIQEQISSMKGLFEDSGTSNKAEEVRKILDKLNRDTIMKNKKME